MKHKKFLMPMLLICFCGFLVFASMKVYAASHIKINTTSPLILDGKEIDACSDANILKGIRIVGYIIVVAKIFVPLLLIITGVTSLLKAVMDADDGATKKAVSLLITKLFVGVFVFFIPSIVTAVLSLVDGYNNLEASFAGCGTCLLQVKKCTNYINDTISNSKGNNPNWFKDGLGGNNSEDNNPHWWSNGSSSNNNDSNGSNWWNRSSSEDSSNNSKGSN